MTRGSGKTRWAVCAIAIVLGAGCLGEEGPVRMDPEHVIYEGEPYGDFLILGDAVRECMGSSMPGLPQIVLSDTLFECYTTQGWQHVYGCSSEDTVYMVAPALVQSEGSLWSHELTHYFGADTERHGCGGLALEHFSLARPVADR